MRVNSIMNTAYDGMNRQVGVIQNAASKIAAWDATGENDLLQNMMDIKVAQHAYDANASVIKTAQEMYDTLLSL